MGSVLIEQGRFIDAERVAGATAEDVQPRGETSSARLTVYGGVLLLGATAAARQSRTGAATELLGEATDVAVVAEDYAGAAKVARRMPRNSTLPLAARSRHLADVAHAQLRLGQPQAVESALLTMERAAPEWARITGCRGCSSASC